MIHSSIIRSIITYKITSLDDSDVSSVVVEHTASSELEDSIQLFDDSDNILFETTPSWIRHHKVPKKYKEYIETLL